MSTSEKTLEDLGCTGIRPSADQVAALIAGKPTIGAVCRALRSAGWKSTVAGNRITVDDRVFVRYIYQAAGPDGPYDARWVVYDIGDRPIVRIVVASDGRAS